MFQDDLMNCPDQNDYENHNETMHTMHSITILVERPSCSILRQSESLKCYDEDWTLKLGFS